MNHALHGGDYRHQGSTTGWASRRRRAVLGPRGLERGVAAHSAGCAQVATGAPQFAHVRTDGSDWQCGATAVAVWATAENSRPEARKPAAAEAGRAYGSEGG